MMNLKKKLVEVRKHIGALQKTTKGQNGMYVDPAVLLMKATDSMNELNVFLSSSVTSSVLTREPLPNKNNPDAKVFCVALNMIMTFHDADSDETLEIPWFAFGKHATDPSMAGGGALTYFERYFIMKTFNVPTTNDDPDNLKDRVRGPELLSDDHKKKITDKIKEIAVIDPEFTGASFLEYMNVNSVDELYAKSFNGAMQNLELALQGRIKGANK